jgi:hypothetical protein
LHSIISLLTFTQITWTRFHIMSDLSFIMLLSWIIQICWYVSTSLVFKQESSSITTEIQRPRVCWVHKIWWVVNYCLHYVSQVITLKSFLSFTHIPQFLSILVHWYLYLGVLTAS